MAIGMLPPTSESWGRWPQAHQPTGADYDMMETGMVPYGYRTGTTAPLQRPGPPQHFLPAQFNQTAMPSNPSPQYQAPVLCGGYVPYGPPPMLDAPFKSEPYLERTPLPGTPLYGRGIQNSWDGLPLVERDRSPSIKSESSQMSSAQFAAPNSITFSKTIIPNVRVQGAPLYESKTRVDELVGVLQTMVFKSVGAEKEELGQADEGTNEGGKSLVTPRGRSKANRKPFRFHCDIPGCSKKFAQRNNLDTHRRAHTGESPYTCPYSDCRLGFTQIINLKTHINRHTGEKPYKCELCGKAFPQRSNVKSHMKIHGKREPFVCKLDSCNKTFTAKGNLKTHQNAFHRDTVLALTTKFASITDESALTTKEKELIKYLMSVHNNANKGIKGRGKGRKVKRIAMSQPYPTPMATPASSPIYGHHPFSVANLPHHGLPQLPQHPTTHTFHGLSNPAAYSMGRPPHMHFGMGLPARDVHGGYDMMHSDASSVGSSSQASSPMNHHMYEDEQERELVFADRMY